MDIVFAVLIFMIWGFDSSSVTSITLKDCFVPNKIILPVLVWPGRNQNFFQTFRCNNITNDRIKGTYLGIIVLNSQRATWFLYFFNWQTIIFYFYHSCPCAVRSATSYHSRYRMLWFNLVARILVKRLVIANSRCDRCYISHNRFFCLNCLISFHPIGCNILSFWYRWCFQNDSWSIFWGLIGCDLLICLDLLCRKG